MTKNKLRALYPELEPFQIHYLDRPGGHRIYLEQCGNRHGIPVIFLHGGPGSGCNPSHRRYFHPQKYHIIIFDQRGSGRSQPHGHLQLNTTQDLIADMEAIRCYLGINQWLLFGGSWGSALALLYAQAYPQWVNGLILRGSFLARQRDLVWFTNHGVSNIFPEDWQAFYEHFAVNQRGDLINACYHAVNSPDPAQRWAAAKAWSNWADRVVTYNLFEQSSLEQDGVKKDGEKQGGEEQNGEDDSSDKQPAQKTVTEAKQSSQRQPSRDEMDFLIRKVALEMHYAIHRYFIWDNQILSHIGLIPRVPVMLIHGRKDLTCPVESSWLLHRAIPQSGLKILPNTGHLMSEPGMIDALLDATDQMAKTLAAQNGY